MNLSIMPKFVRWIASVILLTIVAICVGIGIYVFTYNSEINEADITDTLIKEGVLPNSGSPTYSRICLFPSDDLLAQWFQDNTPGYLRVTNVDVENSSYWTILFVDDNRKVVTKRIVANSQVKYLGGRSCAKNIDLKVAEVSGQKVVEITIRD